MTALRVLGGIVAGFGLAFGSCYVVFHFALHAGATPALVIALVAGAIGSVYSGVAFGRGIYEPGFFSILGYLLDMSWSLLNTTASLLVWLPACLVAGGDAVEPDDNSRRSGTFVYSQNPRGGGYAATTVGTVIGGGWSSHEEMHVWQARLFGPAYMPVYGLALLLNLLFRLFTGNTDGIVMQAYYRICFEDWAYAAGSTAGADINWGAWILWFFLSAIYVACVVLIPAGVVAHLALLSIAGALGLVIYSLIRAFTPAES